MCYVYIYYIKYIYIDIDLFIPRTQMTRVLLGKGLVLRGLTFKKRGHWGSRYIHVCTYTPLRCLS